MSDEQVKLSDQELHILAGLVQAGFNDGQRMWLGTDHQWRFYEYLTIDDERINKLKKRK